MEYFLILEEWENAIKDFFKADFKTNTVSSLLQAAWSGNSSGFHNF